MVYNYVVYVINTLYSYEYMIYNYYYGFFRIDKRTNISGDKMFICKNIWFFGKICILFYLIFVGNKK